MDLNQKLTANFKLKEFTKSDVNDYQLIMLKVLAQQLEEVRTHFNINNNFKKDKSKAVSITITSGVRTQADYERLKSKGYNPSQNSDHFCGYQPGNKPTFGAADIIINNLSISLFDAFKEIAKFANSNAWHFGQVLYESNPKTKSEWIHLSNDPDWLFSSFYMQDYLRNCRNLKIGYSNDNGVTFKKYKV